LFYELGKLVAACAACNSGGGRAVAVANQRNNLARLMQAIEQLDQPVLALSEKVSILEQANGHTPAARTRRAAHLLTPRIPKGGLRPRSARLR
jgi:hypothetical protein